MPERPDIETYIDALDERLTGHALRGVRLANPFLLRSAVPPITDCVDKTVRGFRRLGKRIVFELDDDYFLVLHLMVAGRLQYKEAPGVNVPARRGLCAFDFDHATLLLTEAGTKKRASLYVVRGEEGLADHNRGGLELEDLDEQGFAARLREENHTLKRSLTDPRILSGIGNAYSDEILHRAKLSPVLLTQKLSDEQYAALWRCTREVIEEFTARFKAERKGGFPGKVTAFREDMAVHGKYGKPCPVCGDPIQRISYAKNETNYCATCQTGGKLLADRAMSRLMKKDWPRSLEELEAKKASHRAGAKS